MKNQDEIISEFFFTDMQTSKAIEIVQMTMFEAKERNRCCKEGGSTYRWLLFKDFYSLFWNKNKMYKDPLYNSDLGLYVRMDLISEETKEKRWMFSDMAENLNKILREKGDTFPWRLIGTFHYLAGFGEAHGNHTEENTEQIG